MYFFLEIAGLEKKSQTLNSSNFYVILKGQVIEFQKKAATI